MYSFCTRVRSSGESLVLKNEVKYFYVSTNSTIVTYPSTLPGIFEIPQLSLVPSSLCFYLVRMSCKP